MGRYMLQRILIAIPVLIGVSIVVFLMLHSAGGDPAQQILGPRADPESVAELREEMGLNRPLAVQYAEFAGNALQGDLGRSFRSNATVTDEILTPLSGDDRAGVRGDADRHDDRADCRDRGRGEARFVLRLLQHAGGAARDLDSHLLPGDDPDHRLRGGAALAADLGAGQSAPGRRSLRAVPGDQFGAFMATGWSFAIRWST